MLLVHTANMTLRNLSLCFLVDPETHDLASFLHNVDGVYDELIVVDLGCPETELDALKGLEASVLPWSEKTNRAGALAAALTQAQGRWIFLLEPHERLSPQLKAAVSDFLQLPEASAASIQIQATNPSGGLVSRYAVRLFKSHPSIVLAHALCADPTMSVLNLLNQQDRALQKLEGSAIVHASDSDRQTQYHQARLQELYACTDKTPTDLQAWNMLLQIGHMTQDLDLIRTTAQRLEALLTPEVTVDVAESYWLGDLLVGVADALYKTDPAALRDYLMFWSSHLRLQAPLFLKLGEMFEAESDFEQAQAAFMHCLELRAFTPNIQLTTVRPLLALTRLALAQNDPATALELLNLAIAADPKDSEALFGLTSLTQKLGGQEALGAIVEAYTEAHGDTAEMRTALAEAALQTGDTQSAMTQLEHAEMLMPGGRAQILLRQMRDENTALA